MDIQKSEIDSAASGNTPELRNIKGIAWCWQDKSVLRRIREAFDENNEIATGISVYIALTEIASDFGSNVFRTIQGRIAQRSGCSIKTVKRRLEVLEEIGLVEIYTPKVRAASTYKLLALSDDEKTNHEYEVTSQGAEMPPGCNEDEGEDRDATGHGDATTGHGDVSIGHSRKQVKRATLEEKEIKEKKERIKDAADAALSPDEVRIWNSCEQLPKVQCVTASRLKRLRARRKDPHFVENFAKAIERLARSEFCLGKNGQGWRADFDWFLKPDSVARIMEGSFDNRPKQASVPPHVQLEVMQRAINNHPANHSSTHFNPKHTPEQRDEFKRLKADYEELNRKMAATFKATNPDAR